MLMKHNTERIPALKLGFLNREKEIVRLKKVLDSNDPAFVVVYGRRRIGKSTLLQKIISDKDVYYCADQRNSSLQIVGLAEEISRIIPGFADAEYPSWKALLASINSRAKHEFNSTIIKSY